MAAAAAPTLAAREFRASVCAAESFDEFVGPSLAVAAVCASLPPPDASDAASAAVAFVSAAFEFADAVRDRLDLVP
jgi:hypothetical protein